MYLIVASAAQSQGLTLAAIKQLVAREITERKKANKQILWGEKEHPDSFSDAKEEETSVVGYIQEELIYFVIQEEVTAEWQWQGRKFFSAKGKDGRTLWKIRDREIRDFLVSSYPSTILREFHDKLCIFFLSQNPF